jgi:pimeloyl-ACP methyl ester carboxylesterase
MRRCGATKRRGANSKGTWPLSSSGRVVVAEGAGHMIRYERPDVVVEAIRDVVIAVRS